MELMIGIIGCGRIAKRHAEQAKKYGQLVAVCDVIEEKAQGLAAEYGVNHYSSAAEMIEKEPLINLIAVCTPNGLHPEHTIAGLKAGKHVLCEKPMCITEKDGKMMIETAANAGKRLFIVKSARYNPLIMQLKKMLDEGTLGKVLSFQLNCSWNRPAAYYADNWRGTLLPDGGTLYTQFSHYIDILLWLLGDYRKMSGFRKNLAHQRIIEFEDTGVISLEMENGALGSVHYSVNAEEKNMEISITLLTEKASLKLGGEYMNEIIYQQPVIFEPVEELNGANDYGFYRGSQSNHDKVYENIKKALNGEAHRTTDGPEALKTVAFIEDFYQNTPLS